MRRSSTMAAALLLGVAAGCAGQVEPGEASEGLTVVRKADFVDQQLYIDLRVSPVPLTADELGDTTWATPVEVRFYDEWAVAWYAPGGVAVTNTPGDAVRVWRVVENREATSSDDIVPGGGSSGTTPPAARPGDAARPALGDVLGSAPGTVLPTDDRNFYPLAVLDWYGDWMREWQEMPPGFHPGCI